MDGWLKGLRHPVNEWANTQKETAGIVVYLNFQSDDIDIDIVIRTVVIVLDTPSQTNTTVEYRVKLRQNKQAWSKRRCLRGRKKERETGKISADRKRWVQ